MHEKFKSSYKIMSGLIAVPDHQLLEKKILAVPMICFIGLQTYCKNRKYWNIAVYELTKLVETFKIYCVTVETYLKGKCNKAELYAIHVC